jgi:beta-glucosidase
MNAYHIIDNVPMAAGKEYLRDLLRGELGFKGLTISDYGSIDKLFDVYHIAGDAAEAGIMALEAGIDTETPSISCYSEGMWKAAENGKLDMSLIDNAVRRVLSLKMRLGLFENPFADIEKVKAVFQNQNALTMPISLPARALSC